MKLALSNLAWDEKETYSFLPKIKENGFDYVECVLTKIKPWSELTNNDINKYQKLVLDNGLNFYSVQSLFYGVECNDMKDRFIMTEHLKKIIEFSKMLGIKVLVFGSPNLRKQYNGWEKDAELFFKDVDELLKDTGITLVIEPNSSYYNSEFFITLDEIVSFLKINNFKNIKTMIDTHNLILENFDPTIEFSKHYEYIKHIHVSEVGLSPILETETHNLFAKKIIDMCYEGVVTYEVKKTNDVDKSLEIFNRIYRK